MKKCFFFFLLFLVVSCKSKKTNTSFTTDSSISTKKIIDNHKTQNQFDFQALRINGKTSYSLFNINLDIRIKKDEIIWLSAKAPFIGNVAKIKITPDQVSYYSNYFKEYFQGDYVFLSNWLGVDLDFQKVQNLLLGRTLYELSHEKFDLEIESNLYRISWKENDLYLGYFFEPEYFNLAKQLIQQPKTRRKMSIEYSKYKTENKTNLPYLILLSFTQSNKNNSDQTNQLEIEYKTIDFNTEISFPYEIPQGYKEIEL